MVQNFNKIISLDISISFFGLGSSRGLNLDQINFFKLRASYGSVGNDNASLSLEQLQLILNILCDK